MLTARPSSRRSAAFHALFWLPLLVLFSARAAAQDLNYFEETYQIKLEGIAPRSEQKDLDRYYSQIAKQLGIPRLAFDAVETKYGWKKTDGEITTGIIRRSPDKWTILIVRLSKNPETGKLDIETYEQRFVEINDRKEVVYCEPHQRPWSAARHVRHTLPPPRPRRHLRRLRLPRSLPLRRRDPVRRLLRRPRLLLLR